MTEHDCRYTREPVCPYCGHVGRGAFEIDFGADLNGDAEIQCGSCGEDYHCEREVTVIYSTRKTEEKSND